MGLFDKLFNKKEKDAAKQAVSYFKTLTAYRPVFTTWNGAIYENLMVRAAIDARARHISKLRVQTYGPAKPEIQAAIKTKPNAYQTWSQFLYRVSTILDATNNCFIVPIEDADYNFRGFYPLCPERIELKEYQGELWIVYKFRNGEKAAIEYSRCAILNKFQFQNDFLGSSNEALKETMELIHIQNQGINEAVKNAASYRFMAQVGNFTKAEELVNERKRFSEDNLKSDAGGGGLLLFPNTYTNIKQLETKPYVVDDKQMELINNNVNSYYGVNKDVLQNEAYGDKLSAFNEGCVEVFAVQFSETMTNAIFTDREQKQGNGSGVIATANRLQYMSNADKLQVSVQMADRGLMTINEIREMWQLAPVENGDIFIRRGEYKEDEKSEQ